MGHKQLFDTIAKNTIPDPDQWIWLDGKMCRKPTTRRKRRIFRGILKKFLGK